jgi:hypothetical protein
MNRRRRRTAGRDRVYLVPARGRKVHPVLAVYPVRVCREAARGPAITCTLQAIARNRTRMLGYLPL